MPQVTEHNSPAAIYAERLAARQALARSLAAWLARISWIRLGVFLLVLLVAGLSYFTDLFSPLWTLLPVAGFFGFVIRYEMIRMRLAWAERAAGFYQGGLDRLEGKPGGNGDGKQYVDDQHAYAADLDLFGPGSLFERLTSCRTRIGADTLAAWLKGPAELEEVNARQAAVADLLTRLDLRESLAVAGAAVVDGVDLNWLADWGETKREPVAEWNRWAVEVLGWANVVAWCAWLFAEASVLFVLAAGLAALAWALPLSHWSRRVLAPVEKAEAGLSLLEAVLVRFERANVSSPRVLELQAAMRANGRSAAEQIRELRNHIGWLNARRNPFFWPIAALRLWGTRYAFILEAWRSRSGERVRNWLRAIGEAEALSSLAGYAFENPTDVFPTVERGSPHFRAAGLGHPLIPAERCVCNDVALAVAGPRVLVVSGSNMSGKSTLLRAVGVNAVLALAGSVVRARSLILTPFALGATMRVQDSLQAGRSRFFAEVAKVRALLDLATKHDPPLLFLLDEIFSGTNSADRVAGAEGVLSALLATGAIGLVTTHDLAITAVTARLPGAENVHFCDGFAGGELRFDYTMRPGVVPHGNGLALMRAVGLNV